MGCSIFKIFVGGAVGTLLSILPLHAQQEVNNNPIVVELYTSQGCSSCPPADRLLHKLSETRTDILPLALHVDYWDYIGWKDSFADPENSHRQRVYAHVAGRNMIYTPQMIVMGQDDIIGTNEDQLTRAVANHLSRRSSVNLKVVETEGNVFVKISAEKPSVPSTVVLVQYAPSRTVNILRGELAGHTLEYTNIVENLDTIATWDGKSQITIPVSTIPGLKAAVLVQQQNQGAILSAVRIP